MEPVNPYRPYGPHSYLFERWYFTAQKSLSYVVVCNTISERVQIRQTNNRSNPDLNVRVLDMNMNSFIKLFHQPYFFEMINETCLPSTPKRQLDKLSFADETYTYDMLDFVTERQVHMQMDLQASMPLCGGLNLMMVDIHHEIGTINLQLKHRRTSTIHFYGIDLAIFLTEVPDMLLMLFSARSRFYYEVNICVAYLLRNLTHAWVSKNVTMLSQSITIFKDPELSSVARLARLFWVQEQWCGDLQPHVPWTCLKEWKEEEEKVQLLHFPQILLDILFHFIYSTTWYLDDYEGQDDFTVRAQVKEKPFAEIVQSPAINQQLLDQIRWLKADLNYQQAKLVEVRGIGTTGIIKPPETSVSDNILSEQDPPQPTTPPPQPTTTIPNKMASKKDVSKDSAIEDPSSSPLPTMSQLDKLFEEAADAAEARASRGSQSSKTSKANGTITLDDDEEDDGYEYPPNTLSQEFMGHAPPRLEPFYEYSSQEEEDKRVEKEDSNKTSPKTGNRKRKTPTPVGIKHRMEKKKKKTSRGAMTALKLQPRFDAIAAAATTKEQETGDKPQQDQDVTEPRILLQHVGVVYKNCTFNITGNYVADASGSK